MDLSESALSVIKGTSRHARRIVRFENASPFVIEAATRLIEGTPRLTHLTIKLAESAEDDVAITAVQLRELPLRYLVGAVESALEGTAQDEWFMRSLVRPRAPGERTWLPDHYERVMAVYEWARKAGRVGGGRGTIAEFWGVTLNTADAWLSHARKNGITAASPDGPLHRMDVHTARVDDPTAR